MSASREGVATLAMVHIVGSILQGAGQCQRAGTVMLQQMKRHARGRLHAHAWQTAQRLDQASSELSISHAESEWKFHAARQAGHTGGDLAHFLG